MDLIKESKATNKILEEICDISVLDENKLYRLSSDKFYELLKQRVF